MPAGLLPEFALASVRLVRDSAVRAGAGGSRQDLEDALILTRFGADLFRQVWGSIRKRLETEGYEARDLADRCRLVLEGLDLLEEARQIVRAQIAEASAAQGLGEMEEALDLGLALRQEVADLLAWASRPPAPIDPDRLASGEAAVREGRVISGEELMAQLGAGGDG